MQSQNNNIIQKFLQNIVNSRFENRNNENK